MNFMTGEFTSVATAGQCSAAMRFSIRCRRSSPAGYEPRAQDRCTWGCDRRQSTFQFMRLASIGNQGRSTWKEPIGSDLFLTIDLQGLLVKARTTPDFQTKPGATVYVRFDPRKLHAFDEASGAALT